MTARWESVMDAQLELSIGLGDPASDVARAAAGYAAALGESHPMYASGPGALTRDLPDRLSTMVFNADPVYVDPDMQTVWEASIEGFQAEPLQKTDLVTPAGFLALPRPVYSVDRHGKRMSWRIVLWHPQDLIVVTPESVSPSKQQDLLSRQFRDGSGVALPVEKIDDRSFKSSGLLVTLWHDTGDADDYTEQTVRELGRRPRGLLLTHAMPWGWGEDWGLDSPGVEIAGPPDRGMILRPIQSLWRLMLQTIADRGDERASSPFRRRWERAGWPEKRVTVVRLRRPRQDERDRDEPRQVDWTHRWIVGGHWRWQWHPTRDARTCGHHYADGRTCDKAGGIHRQIWISPFVKGSEDLPLLVNKARVFELVR